MAKNISDVLTEHPVDREQVEKHKRRMIAEVRAYRLRELREEAGLTGGAGQLVPDGSADPGRD